jgi:hypothetical protein
MRRSSASSRSLISGGPSCLAEEMTVQFQRAARLRAGLGVEVHDRDDPQVRPGRQRTRLMGVPPSVEEDQVARMRPEARAVSFHLVHAGRGRVGAKTGSPPAPGEWSVQKRSPVSRLEST